MDEMINVCDFLCNSETVVCILVKSDCVSHPGIAFMYYTLTFMKAGNDKSTNVQDFSLVFELDEKRLKVLRDSHRMVLHLFLGRLKFNRIRKL